MYLLITHMGTMMSVRELCREWKTVVIAVAGLAGMALLLWYVGPLFTDRNAIVTGTPPLSGGVVAAIIMSKTAGDLGMKDMAVMAMLKVFPTSIERISSKIENLLSSIACKFCSCREIGRASCRKRV